MGRVKPGEALAFGLTLSGFAVATLGLLVNWLAGALLAFTIFFYVVVYTIWLKRATPQNIVIGGAAGAFPPMIGWAAVTGSLSLEPIFCSSSSSSGRRRTSGRSRSTAPRTMPAPACPCCRWSRGDTDHAPADPALYADPGAARHRALGARLYRPALRRHRRRDRRDHAGAGLCRCCARAARPRPPADVFSPSRSCICSCCSPCCWSTAGGAG